MRVDDVGFDCVDHLERAVGGVVAVGVLGADVDGEELRAEEALHAGEVGLAFVVRGGDVVALDGERGDVVVGVDEDGFASDAVDLGRGDRAGVRLRDDRDRQRQGENGCECAGAQQRAGVHGRDLESRMCGRRSIHGGRRLLCD